MKSIEIRASLPFSWCRFCTKMELETQKWIADGQVEEIENVCANAAVCEACERARAADLRPADLTPEELPQAERKPGVKGHYIGDYDGYADGAPVYDIWSCSVCGCVFEDWDEKPTYNFCPACGADLREETVK